jgi:ribonucleotide reductase alpha subunit
MENKSKINTVIDYNKDYNFDYFGFKTLERAYLLKINGKVIERPQHMIMRVCLGIHKDDIKEALKSYKMMAEGYFTHATPTLFNVGTQKEQAFSCFLLQMQDDSIRGIYKTLTDCALISQCAGGIGIAAHKIRAKGSSIRGTGGISNGIVPMLKNFNETARYVDQGGGKRKGSIAIYLEPWHADIEDFLHLRRNTGAETERARDLFYAMWIPDLFMERVKADGDWTLMCPDECPGLHTTYGDEFKELYEKYEREGRGRKTIKAQRIWQTMIDSQIETGTPYIGYKDHVNHKSNQKNLGVIQSSNLCVAGDTKILTRKGYIEIQELENQDIEVWNGEEWSKTVARKTGENQDMVKITFSNGEEITCTPYHKFYISKGYNIKTYEEVRAIDLNTDDKLIKWDLPSEESFETSTKEMQYPYTHGFFCGDGTTYYNYSKTCKYPKLTLYHDKQSLLQYINHTSVSSPNELVTHCILPKDMKEKFFVPLDYSTNTKLRWLEGYFDADGTIARNGTNESIQCCSIHIEFLRNIRLLLHTLGIESKITKGLCAGKRLLPDGKGGKQLYDCNESFRLLISSSGLYKLSKLGYKPKRLQFTEREPQRNAEQFVKVINVEKLTNKMDTYCVNEPKQHKAMFNGILTGNCNEINEYTAPDEHAVCCLLSIALPKYLEPVEVKETVKVYSKTDCKFCVAAKNVLTREGIKYEEILLDDDQTRKDTISQLNQEAVKCEDGACTVSGGLIKTVPQIYFGDRRVGGYKELLQELKPKYNYEKLREATKMAVRNLNKLIDYNYYPVPETETSNRRHRPIGIGVQGLADVFAKLRIPFDSAQAVQISRDIAEHMYLAAIQASMDIARKRKKHVQDYRRLLKKQETHPEEFTEDDATKMKELQEKYFIYKDEVEKLPMSLAGAYSSFVGSPASNGQLQFDLWGVEPNTQLADEWAQVKDDIKKHGLRNSLLMAMMPTASTSQILGNNECIEPYTNNIYTRQTLAGTFTIVNKHLIQDCIDLGIWNQELKDRIILANGSVQEITEIPKFIREQYKIVWEMKQKWLVDHAVARAPFVCQTQSMNIFMNDPTPNKINKLHFYAWDKGLKTGIYYLRSKAKTQSQKFSVDMSKYKKVAPVEEEEEECLMCSA